ncbi:MAG: DUF1080 domain-containing protein [Rhodothermales bacterium]|nr:DUF1080 domain-containing protein [Rhodothermales bacterium]MBO6779776.1 DUF1080 domain-containing protein [Rhodothermales bacterium]
MKYLLPILFLTLIPMSACAQSNWPPELTETWEPEPAVVTPGAGTAAPSDAIVLLGDHADAWQSLNGDPVGWSMENGVLTVVAGTGDIRTRQTFGSIQLHMEWRSPTEIQGDGQGRGNSGVFFQERYEVQILDSFENRTYSNGQAGSVYKQYLPLVNAMRPPGEWQTYDIFFTAPVFSDDGAVVRPAFLTVIHNGVLIQNHVELRGPTVYRGLPEYEAHGDGSVRLQDHGNPVSFRNIWVREL